MKNVLKRWWQRRQAKHYLNNHWHLLADIILLLIILGLIITLIIIRHFPKPQVDTSPISHTAQGIASSSKIDSENSSDGEALNLEPEITKKNIYSGQAFALNINLENKSKDNLQSIILVPKLISGGVINKIAGQDLPSGVTIKGNKIMIDDLSSGDLKNLTFNVVISSKDESLKKISWRLDASYKDAGRDFNTTVALPDLKLIADIEIKAAAYYNSQLGDQLGSGPIPPIVDLPTNYWIFFTVKNDDDFSNLTVSAKLPKGVTLSNNKTLSAGDFSYDESQKRLTWTVKKIDNGSGRYQAGFGVQLLPVKEQIGTSPVLLDNISYLAIDAYTEEKISGKLPAINTELPADPINQGQGKVIK